MLTLAYKSLYAACSLERATERRDEYFELPERNACEREFKAKKIMEGDARVAEIKREIYRFNNKL